MKPKKMAKKINMILAMSILMVTLTGSMVFAATVARATTVAGSNLYYWGTSSSGYGEAEMYWYDSNVYNPVYKNNGMHMNVAIYSYRGNGVYRWESGSNWGTQQIGTEAYGNYDGWSMRYSVVDNNNYNNVWANNLWVNP